MNRRARMTTAAIAAPTPIPAFAPVLRIDGVDVAVVVGAAIAV